MSVRGWVQGCEWQRRGSELTADVAEDGILLTVEDLTDFDDAGGVLSINDQTIGYDADAIDEDAGTILIDTGLAGAATIGDPVFTVAGGQVLQDVVLYVDCGDGDLVEVRVPFAQRDYWPEGDYEEPVLVELSDDLEKVLDAPGRIPVSTELAEARGGYTGTLQDIFDSADAAAAAAADAAANATTAVTAANGKNKVTYSLSSPGSTANSAGDIWFRKHSLTQTIIEQWLGQGGTSWQQVTLNDQVIANLDAGKLVAGSAFTNSLSVKTNFTLGDASTNGVIQSYNFAGSSVGVYLDKFGLVAKGGSIAGASITGSTFSTGGSFPLTISDDSIVFYGGMSVGYAAGDLQLSNGASAIQIGSGIDIFSPTTFHDGVNGDLSVSGRVTADSFDHTGTPPGSAGTANAYIDSSGLITKSTSSQRYKYDIEDVELNGDAVHDLRFRTFRRLDDPLYDPDDPTAAQRWTGLVAEEVAALGLPVVRDAEDRPDGIDWWVLTLHVVQALKDERAQRQQDVADLTARIEQLEAS